MKTVYEINIIAKFKLVPKEDETFKYIRSIIDTTGISGLLSLEFSDKEPNPVVYSRNGKSHYNSSKMASLNVTFDANNLKTTLNTDDAEKVKQYKWSFMNSSKKIEPYYIPISNKDRTLIFESRFESGNLEMAIKANDLEYFLIMQKDTLTKGRTQCISF